ncbi:MULTISPECIES: DUF4236 domain-containing protein [unclassified Cryobacterium]|uniref:DUF4236 domain-containing protein n=1 Tax=unclassified Cryobacterium TaxID=2649013 RepID=UPI0010699529|nr:MULTISPECIES: DUF4236 domain-containing protein [unclassified Cryobacterium]TFC20197.1 DUF4236 domain-containing protein [Cryobacterium sp. MDB2-10]TFC26989.1 DUF4236 domain-containing protein [Cryobacterium sp. MDB1-18-2]TFC44181.1 DUF4236 domain-containing protein [Cryobacterium sp. MDB1-18-1]
MGFFFRKQIKLGKTAHVNVSKSGMSVTKKLGPVTLNSRGGGRIRLAKGVYFRFGKRR